MNYAVIRVRLPAIKNLKIYQVLGLANDQLYRLQIQIVRYNRRGNQIKSAITRKAKRAKATSR